MSVDPCRMCRGRACTFLSSLVALSLLAAFSCLVTIHVDRDGSSGLQIRLQFLRLQNFEAARTHRQEEHQDELPGEVVFIMVGAIRTLNQTKESIQVNVIERLCPPSKCIARLVMLLSQVDNRPDPDTNDPRGVENSERAMISPDTFFTPTDRMSVHPVAPHFDTGSDEEQRVMDMIELEHSGSICDRLRLLRACDPRRYSMWVSRFSAWRFARNELFQPGHSIKLVVFLRPDMLFYLPFPSPDYFETHASREPGLEDIWFHDSYYEVLPDTFAIMRSHEAADRYFSLEALVEPGVACCGGPTFNKTVVRERLHSLNITSQPSDWCATEQAGFSERILLRRMNGSESLIMRFFPAGAVLLRPGGVMNCEAVRIWAATRGTTLSTRYAHAPSDVPLAGCLHAQSLGNIASDFRESHPVRFIRRDPSNQTVLQCWTSITFNETGPRPCIVPIPPNQLFLRLPDSSSSNRVRLVKRGDCRYPRDLELTKSDAAAGAPADEADWKATPAPLYTTELMKPVLTSWQGMFKGDPPYEDVCSSAYRIYDDDDDDGFFSME